MFGKVKKILGIEGVKLELIIPEKISKETGLITGIIKLTSLSDDNHIEGIHLSLVEKYSRGRGGSKLINEYVMGETLTKDKLTISRNEIIEIPFELDFMFSKSEMDKLEENNFVTSGIVKLAKKIQGVSSEYYLRAEARIKGTTLHPMDNKPVLLT